MLHKPTKNGELLDFCFALRRAIGESARPIDDPVVFGQLVAAAQDPERDTAYPPEVANLWMKGYALPEKHVCDAMVAMFSDSDSGRQLQEKWAKAAAVEDPRLLPEPLLVINGWVNQHKLGARTLMGMLGEYGYEGHPNSARMSDWLSNKEPMPKAVQHAFAEMMAAPALGRLAPRSGMER